MTEITLPSYLQNVQSTNSAAIAEAAQGPRARVSLENKRFTLIEGEESKPPVKSLDVVILGFYPSDKTFNKQYREKAYNPKTNRGESPDCASDGIRPFAWVEKPIHTDCATCPFNQFGSDVNGGKGKRCRDSKTVYVALPDDLNKIYMVNMAYSNWVALATYVKSGTMGAPIEAAITKLTFDEDAAIAILKFELAGFLPEAGALEAMKIAKDKDFLPSPSSSQTSLPPPSKPVQAALVADDSTVVADVKPTASKTDSKSVLEDWD